MNPKLFLLIGLPFLTGFLFLFRLLYKSRIPLKLFFIIASASPVGYALISLGLFFCFLAGPAYTKLFCAVFPWFVILLCLLRLAYVPLRQGESGNSFFFSLRQCFFGGWSGGARYIVHSLLSWVLLALLAYMLQNFLLRLWGYFNWNAFGGWDARYFWFLKARFMVRDPLQWTEAFSPLLQWGNPDYPFMMPGILAWGWNMMGREALIWPMLVSFIFVLSLAGLVMWYLAAWRSWPTALAAGIYFITLHSVWFWAGAMYCDIPFAFFATGSILLLVTALRRMELRLFFLAAFLAGCSAWMKNEGLFFIGWFWILALSAAAVETFKNASNGLKTVYALTAGMLLPLGAVIYFKLGFTDHQTHVLRQISLSETGGMAADRVQIILAGLLAHMSNYENWQGLWAALACAVLYWPFSRMARRQAYSAIVFLALLLMLAGYSAILILTHVDAYKLLGMTQMRLILQCAPLALVFIFETFGVNRPDIAPISNRPAVNL